MNLPSPIRSALIAYYHRHQRNLARNKLLWPLFVALPVWEKAIVLAPIALWAASFILYGGGSSYTQVRDLLINLARDFCIIQRVNALCAIGPAEFLLKEKFAGLQLVGIHFLSIALSLLLIALQSVRFLLRIQAATLTVTWRNWLFGLFLLTAFHTGLLVYLHYFVSVKGSFIASLIAAGSLFYLRLLLSPLIRNKDTTTAADSTSVVRRSH